MTEHDSRATQSAARTVSTCLHTVDGVYAGSLHLQSTVPAGPEWTHVRIGDQADGTNAAVVLADATVLPVPGRPAGDFLTSGAPLPSAVATAHRAGELFERCLWRDASGGWHAVSARPDEGTILVSESRTVLPRGLTVRELEVLTLVTSGSTNPQIARLLVLSDKTVAKHVEHLLTKLGCPSRAAAAAQAVRWGLIELALTTPGAAGRSGATG